MILPQNKTKIVCTIGPASATPEVMAKLIRAGMNVARLNFSHGDFPSHKKMIENLREASRSAGKPVAIMADLSGPKIRIGELSREPIELKADRRVILSTEDIVGDAVRISVSFSRLPRAVRPGNMLFLNDGYIQLEVEEVRGKEVSCKVVVGGELRSRQGLNLPGIQKELMRKANLVGKPVITATQMLESMTSNRRPTRAEATDVANAILDGTDCVMLSGESAIGKYPVEAAAMLARIAAAIEPLRPAQPARKAIRPARKGAAMSLHDLIALGVETASHHASPAVVIVPTRSGVTARSIARFRLPMWITAVSSLKSTCQNLQFSYGVHPVHAPEYPEDWKAFAREWLRDHGVDGDLVVLTEGPSLRHPEANNRMEIIDLSRR